MDFTERKQNHLVAFRRRASACVGWFVCCLTVSSFAAWAQEGDQPALGVTGRDQSAPAAPPPQVRAVPEVDLDQLLQLPSSIDFEQQERNGISSDVWKARFRQSFASIRAAESRIAKTKGELDSLSSSSGSGQWQMAPPGAGTNTEVSPMSFKLREQLREQRAALDAAELSHRELAIQADLAGVPEAWRRPLAAN